MKCSKNTKNTKNIKTQRTSTTTATRKTITSPKNNNNNYITKDKYKHFEVQTIQENKIENAKNQDFLAYCKGATDKPTD